MPEQLTYPNQRMIKIHREPAAPPFLGIKNENWQAAARDLGAHALMLYLYLASNANNYTLALSPAALRQSVGMARSTYHDQFHKLVDRGYLVPVYGNTYEFYETPQPRPELHSVNELSADGLDFENCTADDIPMPQIEQDVLPEDIEINNMDIEKNSMINSPKVKEIVISPPEVTAKKTLTPVKPLSKGKFVF